MKSLRKSKTFTGRAYELGLLREEFKKTETGASFVTAYGRRRVGKTRLITEFYKDKNLWRFDGVEGQPKSFQIKNFLKQISTYTGDQLYQSAACSTWIDLFKVLDKALLSKKMSPCTVFIDELPYMASRKTEIIAALKWAWDNLWQDRTGFTLVLCGSIASFMVKKVIKSSSLYGRIRLEIRLLPLSIPEVFDFFGGKKSIREICDLYFFCGGIPEYLLQIDPTQSAALNMSRLALRKDGYFVGEFERLFKDIFQEEMIYKKIILLLSRHKNLKIPEITKHLGTSVGSGFTAYLENLELAGFVKSIVPLDKNDDSRLKRYRLDDEYLLFYVIILTGF